MNPDTALARLDEANACHDDDPGAETGVVRRAVVRGELRQGVVRSASWTARRPSPLPRPYSDRALRT